MKKARPIESTKMIADITSYLKRLKSENDKQVEWLISALNTNGLDKLRRWQIWEFYSHLGLPYYYWGQAGANALLQKSLTGWSALYAGARLCLCEIKLAAMTKDGNWYAHHEIVLRSFTMLVVNDLSSFMDAMNTIVARSELFHAPSRQYLPALATFIRSRLTEANSPWRTVAALQDYGPYEGVIENWDEGGAKLAGALTAYCDYHLERRLKPSLSKGCGVYP